MSPYLSIWFKPSKTIDEVISGKVGFKYYIPILLAGISGGIGSKSFIFDIDKIGYLIISLLTQVILAYIVIGFFFPWAVQLTGKIWKGQAKFEQLQTVFGISQIPVILVLSLQILNLIFGHLKSADQVNNGIQLIGWFFYIRTLIIGVSKVQKFSYGLAIVNLVIMISPFILLRLMIGN